MSAAIQIDGVTHHYGDRLALHNVSLELGDGEIFGLLGPNGGGKTTLFRLVSTLMPLRQGRIVVGGHDVMVAAEAVRRCLGITFQSPSLDPRLTVRENLVHQGHLYGLFGRYLSTRIEEVLTRLQLSDRSSDRCETLSGGLKRRVEIAKGLLHRPRVLLLDEPSTGLDPGARIDLWRFLRSLSEQGVGVFVTTHLMEEAAQCDRLAILSRGQVVALGTPQALQDEIGGDCITLTSPTLESLITSLQTDYGLEAQELGGALRVTTPDAQNVVAQLMQRNDLPIESLSIGRPTLEDVFIARTGHRFWEESV